MIAKKDIRLIEDIYAVVDDIDSNAADLSNSIQELRRELATLLEQPKKAKERNGKRRN